MSSVREIDIRNSTCYFFNNVINIKNLDPNNIKIYKKSYKNILVQANESKDALEKRSGTMEKN